ncbi:hypothetical protein P692DRAFT_20822169 [Suillus brevipes Sb2]|nr:hypothetical protein P692DRAFT_20822169 [Suillus brevipes Sb2]
MEPLSTPLKTLKAVLDATSSSSDKSDSEERAAIVTETGKGKAAMKTIIKIDSSTDVELHAAPIMGHGKNKTATGSAKSTTTPSLRESDANNDAVLSLPLSGTPFADLPYDRQLEIVSFALEQEVTGELGLHIDDDSINYEDGDDVMEFGDDAMDLDSEIEDASPITKKILKGLTVWVALLQHIHTNNGTDKCNGHREAVGPAAGQEG